MSAGSVMGFLLSEGIQAAVKFEACTGKVSTTVLGNSKRQDDYRHYDTVASCVKGEHNES